MLPNGHLDKVSFHSSNITHSFELQEQKEVRDENSTKKSHKILIPTLFIEATMAKSARTYLIEEESCNDVLKVRLLDRIIHDIGLGPRDTLRVF